jgi:Kef-type K+ transport system membrane component KefB
MSAAPAAPKGIGTRLVQAAALGVSFALMYGATQLLDELTGPAAVIAAVGFLLLAGTLLSELVEPFGLPHLSGYLAAGVVAGPHVLHLVGHGTVEDLSPVNTLALALIALAGGAELRMEVLRQTLRSLGFAQLSQSLLVLVLTTGAFVLASRYIPFTVELPLSALLGIALLWGVLSVSRSPSACLAILSQTRARGPLTTFSVAFIMSSDVVVVLLLAAAMVVARPLVLPGSALELEAFSLLFHEIVGSVAIGVTLGLVLAIYLRLVERQLVVVLLVIGFVLTEGLRYIHFDPLLAFLSAGFVVQNLSKQGPKLLAAIEQMAGVVYVVFFATAGAHLDVPLLRLLWPVALGLAAVRAIATWIAARVGSRLADDLAVVRRWGWSGLVSQAGLTLGLSVVIERTFPGVGAGFRSLVIATVAINELVGPVLFKLALDRSGESDPTGGLERSSMTSPP